MLLFFLRFIHILTINNDFNDEFDPDSNYFDDIIAENHVFSCYNSIDDLFSQNHKLQNSSYLSIFGQNIRSLNRNLDNFLLPFDENNMPDVLVFSETWKDEYDPVLIPGYIGYHTVRQGRAGGVSVFVKSKLISETIQNLSFANDSIEICAVKVSNESSSMIIFWNL